MDKVMYPAAVHQYAEMMHNLDEAILECHRSKPGHQGRSGSRSAAEHDECQKIGRIERSMMGASSLAAAQTASLQLDLKSLGERTARVTREQRLQVRRLQRQQAASLHQAPAVPPASQPEAVSGKRKRGGVGVSK